MLIHNLKERNSISKSYKEFLIHSSFYKSLSVCPISVLDLEMIENYASLVKGLSINLDGENLTEFLLNSSFALIESSRKMIFHSESMVRIAGRSSILKIISAYNFEVREYIVNSGYLHYVVHSLRESFFGLEQEILKKVNQNSLECLVEEHTETLYFINDIFGLKDSYLTRLLLDMLMQFIFYPIVMGSLITNKRFSYHMSTQTTLFFLNYFLDIIKLPEFVNLAISMLLDKNIKSDILSMCLAPIPRTYVEVNVSDKISKNPIVMALILLMRSKDDSIVNLASLVLIKCLSKGNFNQKEKIIPHLQKALKENKYMNTSYHLSVLLRLITDQTTIKEIILPALEQVLRRLEVIVSNKYLEQAIIQTIDKENALFKDFSVSKPFVIQLLSSYDDYQSKIPLAYRGPETELEEVKFNVFLYILFRKLIYEDERHPLRREIEWEEKGVYSISNKSVIPCYINSNRHYCVEDVDYLVLGISDSAKLYHVKITHILPLTNLETHLDGNSLQIIENSHYSSIVLKLTFDDKEFSEEMRRMIETNRSKSQQQLINRFKSSLF